MSAGTASLFLTLLFVVFVCADKKNITADSGQDVTLTCRAPNNNIKSVEWSRADLRDKNVLLYHNGHFAPSNQHPSFKNRVDLQDRQMKDGDVSLILKDVTINDTGTYKCRVSMEETDSWKSINSTNLRVVPPYPKIITVKAGQDVNLTCRAPKNKIRVVEWSRADLGDEYVLLYRAGSITPANQHPSFKNRVDLQDRQMKDGDVSLILNNVTINDTGTYMCGVAQKEPNQERPNLKLINSIYLHVDPPGQTGGQEKDEDNKDGGKEDKEKEDGDNKDGRNRGLPEWSIGLIVFLGIVLLVVVIVKIYKKLQQWKIKRRKQPRRSVGFSKLNSESPLAVPKSQSCPTRRKTDAQGPKETDDADLHHQSSSSTVIQMV
ncbi:polymeric immunoglobulin receptor-like [Oreochromis aureus]|uniref:Ig-like domain-containing protein n=1 Tax=Oreochromis aureus TaxID=47969 RepID=A0AAZ1X7F4_OREAU|nr:polymeric immunoglobulin receptor-like [Oreochromis aureus]